MAKTVVWFVGFATLASLPILVQSESGEIPALQIPDIEGESLYQSDSMVQLTMIPKSINARCVFEFKICGIQMCVNEGKGNSEDVDSGKQSSIRDTTGNKNRVSHKNKKCICRNNEALLFVEQDVMELPDQYFVKYRVQEVHENGCRAFACDWKMNLFTVTNEHNENDVIGCIQKKTCTIVCHIRKMKLLHDEYSFLKFVAGTVVLCIITLLTCITFINCIRYPELQGRDTETKSTKQADDQPSFFADVSSNADDVITSDDETEGEDNEADYRRYFPIHDRFPKEEPDHLKYRMRI